MTEFQCAFCGRSILGSDQSARRLEAYSLWGLSDASQEIYSHADCLAKLLHVSVPFDMEMYED
jgi:hypothetical protein